VACSYGRAEYTELTGNRIEKAQNTLIDFKPVRMGSLEQPDYLAHGTEFRSNILTGLEFGIDATEQHHDYSVYWTLKINLLDKTGNPLKDTEIVVADRNGKEVVRKKSGNEGSISVELPEYSVDGAAKTYISPYTVMAGKKKMKSELKNNSEINLVIK
jgi:hypothetical protein